MKKYAAILAGLLSLIPSITSAADWRTALSEYVQTADGVNQDSLIVQIESAQPDWQAVMAELTSLSFPNTSKGQVLKGALLCGDGVVRPYALYVPSGYNPKIATPMLMHLHGIVSRPNIETDLKTYVGDSAIMSVAEQRHDHADKIPDMRPNSIHQPQPYQHNGHIYTAVGSIDPNPLRSDATKAARRRAPSSQRLAAEPTARQTSLAIGMADSNRRFRQRP